MTTAAVGAARTLVVAVALLGIAGEAACERPRNVLLVSIDSLRADRLGVYGNPRPTSPTLDRLSREGVRFAHAMSVTSWTLPAHTTLLSGLHQHSHMVINTSDRIPLSIEFVQQVFAARGYETVGFFSGSFLHPVYGFARGFERYVSCQPEVPAEPGKDGFWRADHDDRTNQLVLARFAGWLRQRSKRPFFAFVHLWDVHFDYIAPAPYASAFTDPAYDGRLDGRAINGTGFPLTARPREVAHLLALYDAEIRYTDETLGRLLALLREAGALGDTLVVVTADHGEEFMDHGNKTHLRTLHQEVVHVPLILWAARGLPRGLAIAEPVSLIDVAPTVLDLAGLPRLRAAQGRSLAPLIRGERLPSRPVVAELYESKRPRLSLVSVRQGDRKAIYAPRRREWKVYDLAGDPLEQRPLTLPDGEGLGAKTLAVARRAETALAGRQSTARTRPAAPLPPEVTERLRSLGYIQ